MKVVCCSRDWRILRVNILKFQADDANGMSPSDGFDVEAYSGGNQILAEHVIKVTEHKTYDIISIFHGCKVGMEKSIMRVTVQ